MRLVVLDGPTRGKEFPADELPVTLGRKGELDVSLPHDARISRMHCRLFEEDGSVWLEDLGSTNGTFLDGEAVSEPRTVEPNAVIQVGDTRLRYLDTDSAQAEIDTAGSAELPRVQTFDTPDRNVMVTGVLDPRELLDATAGPARRRSEEALQMRLDLIQEVAETLAGKLEIRQLMEAVADSILEAMPAERLYILSIGEGGEITPLVGRDRSGRKEEMVAFSRTILDRTLKERVAVLLHDALSDEQLRGRQSIAMAAIRSAMCVPVIHGDQVRAVIHLDASAARAFTDEDLEVVTTIANQAGLALANAELFEELRAAQERLVQSEKLSTIGTLSASIAHDVGNVLTPISTISEKVLRSADLDPKLQEIFERQMGKLKALMTQLLSFSRQSPPELQPVDVPAVLEDAVNLVRTQARHSGVEIELKYEEGLPRAMADVNRLDQVVVNLMINAFHAMEKTGGGTLEVRIELREPHLAISVQDTGPGIPPAILEKVFEPFFTTKGDKGTGLGLYSCKRIVEEEHGGRLEVETEEGVGTTFTILLPTASDSTEG